MNSVSDSQGAIGHSPIDATARAQRELRQSSSRCTPDPGALSCSPHHTVIPAQAGIHFALAVWSQPSRPALRASHRFD